MSAHPEDRRLLAETYAALCSVGGMPTSGEALARLAAALQAHAYALGRKRGALDVRDVLDQADAAMRPGDD